MPLKAIKIMFDKYKYNKKMTKSQKQGKLYLQITIVVTIILFNLLAYAVN